MKEYRIIFPTMLYKQRLNYILIKLLIKLQFDECIDNHFDCINREN